ncbi:uncharacterized protein LOC132544064 [Ylistrum balloti]|uniref:uncharacterized protein LOC132544064 n=1 Tax=Ylistrum balloti TaxID=509963 RepID=UPI002905CDED|nr:uncharacterized protein LOC132544064 [Ylistrum balloti]
MKQVSALSYLLVIVSFLVCLLSLVVETAPTPGYTGVWRNPCEDTTPSFEPYNTTNQEKSMVLSDINTNLNEAENIATDIKNEYRLHRVASQVSNETCVSNFEDNLDNIYLHVPGFPDLSTYFVGSDAIAICANISAALLHDYKNLVRVMIYLEETIQEEHDESYEQQLKNLHDAIKGVMCKFHVLEQPCGLEEQGLNVTDIIKQYKVSRQNERDYLLIRDTIILMRGLHKRYNTCNALYSKTSG